MASSISPKSVNLTLDVRQDVRVLRQGLAPGAREARQKFGEYGRDRTGLKKSYIGKVETAETDPKVGAILPLARDLGVAKADLFAPEGPSIYAEVLLLLHARGEAFTERLKALLEVSPDCLPRRST